MPNLQNFRGVLTTPLWNGDRGVEKTIQMIRDVVDSGVKDPVVNSAAIGILKNRGVENFDREAKLRALYDFVSWPNFLYVEDPVGPKGPKETIRTPRTLLRLKAGDCDDYTVLLAALAGTIGISTRAVTVAADPSLPSDFSHIYPEAEVSPGVWVPMDAARPGAAFGLPALKYFRKRIWSLTNPSYQDVAGMGCKNCGCKKCNKTAPRVSSLNGYAIIGLGDDTSEICAVGQSVSSIIDSFTGSPYDSYQTGCSPAIAAPAAGYPSATLSLSGSDMAMWGIGLVAVLLLLKGGR